MGRSWAQSEPGAGVRIGEVALVSRRKSSLDVGCPDPAHLMPGLFSPKPYREFKAEPKYAIRNISEQVLGFGMIKEIMIAALGAVVATALIGVFAYMGEGQLIRLLGGVTQDQIETDSAGSALGLDCIVKSVEERREPGDNDVSAIVALTDQEISQSYVITGGGCRSAKAFPQYTAPIGVDRLGDAGRTWECEARFTGSHAIAESVEAYLIACRVDRTN